MPASQPAPRILREVERVGEDESGGDFKFPGNTNRPQQAPNSTEGPINRKQSTAWPALSILLVLLFIFFGLIVAIDVSWLDVVDELRALLEVMTDELL